MPIQGIDAQIHVLPVAEASLQLSAPRDSDGDGMPDAWERGHGLDPDAADANGDRDRDGFTNIEEWLADLVGA